MSISSISDAIDTYLEPLAHVLSNIFQDVSEIGKNISGIIHTEISN